MFRPGVAAIIAPRSPEGVPTGLAQGRVEQERVFVLELKTLAAEKSGKVSDSRVDFVIR